MLQRRGGKPRVWVTWITGLLSGEKHCAWAAWAKARYRYDKVPDDGFNRDDWNARHAELVRRHTERLEQSGYAVSVEDQNDFTVIGKTGTALVGKMDMLATQGNAVIVADAKSGRPKDADKWQVRVYLYAIPKSMVEFAGKIVTGQVVYGDGQVVDVPALTGEQAGLITSIMRVMGADDEPKRIPSVRECKYCDISECTARKREDEEPPASVPPAEF